ncbi:MAG: prolipoprotein diacylglyceryl transferase [Bacteroidetes bacterium]|nr:prolipoprotein diacylglyceryl transferase [Bacteroidota bacterium]
MNVHSRSIADRDGLLHPHMRLLGRDLPAFHLCAVAGLVAGLALVTALALRLGLAPLVEAGLAAIAVALFLVYAMMHKMITGQESLVHYRALLMVIAGVASAAWFAGLPVLRFMDITILGVGTFAAFGRVGCLMVGCCHGRPGRHGIRYREEHARSGFPRSFVGVPLLPVQAVEAVALAAIVAGGCTILLGGARPGSALVWYFVAYGTLRFCLEFLRGDADRPYMLGFSEAQWTAVLVVAALCVAGYCGAVPVLPWHSGMLGALAAAMIAVAAGRGMDNDECFQLLHPVHVSELARIVAMRRAEPRIEGDESDSAASARPIVTSRGVSVTGGLIGTARGTSYYFALSRRGHRFGLQGAQRLAELMVLLCNGRTWELVRGRWGVVHLLIDVQPGGSGGHESATKKETSYPSLAGE